MTMKKTFLLLLALAGCHHDEPEAEVAPVVNVKVTKVAIEDVDLSVSAPATIFPREQASISSSVTAPIRALRARKGDRVAKDQVLAVLEDRDLQAQKGEAVAAVRQAEVLRARRAELYQQGAIPHRDLLSTETDLVQSRARLDRIAAQIHFTELRSPFAGTIVEQQLYPGDMVKPDTPVFTVVDLSVAVARAQVPEADVRGIKVGQPVRFVSDDGGPVVQGRVTMVNQAVDPARRTVEVWGELPNADGALRDKVFGHLTIVTEHRPGRVVVPKAALQLGDESATAMVVETAGTKRTAHKREVHVAALLGDKVALADGLRAGEVIVLEGAYGLPDGAEVVVSSAP